jgi:FKBP-type peptidyl-prolyl cis-trans isomerase
MKRLNICLAVLVTIVNVVIGDRSLADAGAERAFMATKAKVAGIQSVPTVQYLVKHSGSKSVPSATRNSAVELRFEGRYIDGKVFDDGGGKPIICPVRAVIPGIQAVCAPVTSGTSMCRWSWLMVG